MKVFDDSHFYRLQNKGMFDGIGRYISEIRESTTTDIVFTSSILPVKGLLKNRWLYYMTLSLILATKRNYVIVFPFLYAPFGFWKCFIIVVHDMRYFESNRDNMLMYLRKKYIKLTFRRALKIICISEFTKSRFIDTIKNPIMTKKLSVIYNPYNFRNIAEICKENIALYIGHLEERKNVTGLLEFIRRNKDIEFIILGKNKIGDKFLEECSSIVNVQYFSVVSEEVKQFLLRRAKYLVNISSYTVKHALILKTIKM